jgi:hypothetical protein
MASSGINIQSPVDGVSMIAIKVASFAGAVGTSSREPHQFAQLYIIDNADA